MSDQRAFGASVAKAQGLDPSSMSDADLQGHGQASYDAMGKGKAPPVFKPAAGAAADAVAPEVALPAQAVLAGIKGKKSAGPVSRAGLGKAAGNIAGGAASLGRGKGNLGLPLPGGASPLGKVFSAVLAGWAVLEVGALLTGQSFSLSLLERWPGKGGTKAGQPGTLISYGASATAAKPLVSLYPGQQADLAKLAVGAPNAGPAAATSGLAHAGVLQ